jgi:hypothetical protein
VTFTRGAIPTYALPDLAIPEFALPFAGTVSTSRPDVFSITTQLDLLLTADLVLTSSVSGDCQLDILITGTVER